MDRNQIFSESPLLLGFLATALEDAQHAEHEEAFSDGREERGTGTVYTCPDATLRHARAMCDAFYAGLGCDALAESMCDYEQLGSDLYMEMAGHGVGFRDRTHDSDCDESRRIGETLSAAVDDRYTLESYIGDDGQVWFVGGERA